MPTGCYRDYILVTEFFLLYANVSVFTDRQFSEVEKLHVTSPALFCVRV